MQDARSTSWGLSGLWPYGTAFEVPIGLAGLFAVSVGPFLAAGQLFSWFMDQDLVDDAGGFVVLPAHLPAGGDRASRPWARADATAVLDH